MSLARRYFLPGRYLILTERAQRMGLQGRARSPLGRMLRQVLPTLIVVQRDGIKGKERYAASFWRKATIAEIRKYRGGS